MGQVRERDESAGGLTHAPQIGIANLRGDASESDAAAFGPFADARDEAAFWQFVDGAAAMIREILEEEAKREGRPAPNESRALGGAIEANHRRAARGRKRKKEQDQ